MLNSSNYNTIYRDLDLDMKKNDITADFKLRTGATAVTQSIKNIVLTKNGERPFNRDFGFGMYDKLFELNDPAFIGDIKLRMAATINELERRVFVTSEDIFIKTTGNEVEINIKYTLKSAYNGSISEKQQVTIIMTGT